MNRKINIFGIDITVLTAKEVMKCAIQYLEEETVNTIELVTLEMLMKEKDDEIWREQVQKFDLLLPGEKALLETSEELEHNLVRDVDNATFLRMFFKYLQKNRKTLFLLAESEDELVRIQTVLKLYASSLLIAGQAVLPTDGSMEENVINEINGVEPDCILSGLSTPYGETFAVRRKALLNARLLLNGILAVSESKEKKTSGRIVQFMMKKFFHYQVKKQKTDMTDIN